MPVVSVAIFLAHTNFNTKTRTGLLETDDDNTIFPDRIYLKRWKDPDKADTQGQGGAGEREVPLDRVQRKTLQ